MDRHAMLVVEDDADLARDIARAVSSRVPARAVTRGDEALALVAAGGQRWLGAIVDVGLPDQSGIEVARRLRTLSPAMSVLVLTGRAEQHLANDAVAADAQFAFKPLGTDELQAFVGRAIARHPESRLKQTLREFAKAYRFTPREAEILALAVAGTSRCALCTRFDITNNTLKTQIRSLCAKSGERTLDDVVRRVFEAALSRS